ncbi:MAG TPA: methylmalonyl-CoA epimerase [bacterium]|nr:methylmalonyl-CoA epimerase [bacterium]
MSEPGGTEIRLAHLGIAVRRIAAAEALCRRLGLPPSRHETLGREGVRVAFVPVGDGEIELLEPLTAEGPVGRFLEGRGEGIHHLALEVPDIDAALARARAAGMRLIDETPRPGADGSRIAFIHPASTHGVLFELVERGTGTRDLPSAFSM